MSTRPSRETAYRMFAAEFEDTTLSYTESDEERAPNYVVTPTGARVNRLFAVGVLTEVESVNEEQLRARVVDPTGAFVVYAGQYQPEALSFLERIEVPTFVAVMGKARTFQPEDSNRVYTSVRPETLSEVDATTRDRWTVQTAERTTERVETMAGARKRDEWGDALTEILTEEGVETGLAAGIPLALDHYGTTPTYLDALDEMALDAMRVVAGERDEVPALSVTPGEGDSTEASTSAPTATAGGTETTQTSNGTSAGREQGSEATQSSETESTSDERREEGVTAEASADSMAKTETDSTDIESEGAATTEPGRDESETEVSSPPSDESDDTEGTLEASDEQSSAGEQGDGFDPEEFELDDEERERIEAEYGTDFESAADVDGPGEAGIETPDVPEPEEGKTTDADHAETAEPDDLEEATDAPTATESTEPTSDDEINETGASELGEDEPTTADEPTDEQPDATTDLDPEDAVVEAMRALDDGDGAGREAVIERVVKNGLSRDEAEEGIQSALMSGECYEPDDDTLKPI